MYSNGTEDEKESTAERIEDYYTSLTLETANADMEKLLQIIQNLKLHTLEEKEVTHYKRELLRVVYIPKLEEQIKDIILKISNIEDTTEDNQERLKLIYTLLSNMEEFKEQTRNIKRDTNKCNEDYNYIFNYLQIAQYLVKSMNKATEYKSIKQPATIRPFVISS